MHPLGYLNGSSKTLSLFKRIQKFAENDTVYLHILPYTGKIDKTLAPLPQWKDNYETIDNNNTL